MDLSQFLTIAGAGAVIVALVEAIKRLLRWDQESTVRFAPALSILLGIAIIGAGTLVAPIDPVVGFAGSLFSAVLQGIISGATSTGIYQTVGKPAIVATIGPSGEA